MHLHHRHSHNLNRMKYFFLLIAFFLQGCDANRLFDENKKIDNSIWQKDKPLIFQVQINDTVAPHNVYINVRNAGVYPFSNLFMFINTRLPEGQLFRDTIEIMLQTPDGKWLGDGLGDIWDNRILFKPNVRFPQAGEYTFELYHAMRIDPLPGIMDAGIRIEKAQQQ